MNSRDQQQIDEQLYKLMAAQKEVHAPSELKAYLLCQAGARQAVSSQPSQKATIKGYMKFWPAAAAASIFALVVTVASLNQENRIGGSIVKTAPHPISGTEYIVTRAYVPVSIHSLSRGPEVYFQRSHLLHYRNKTTKVTYVNLQTQE